MARSPRSKFQQCWLLLKTLRETALGLSVRFWWFAGNLWQSLAYTCIILSLPSCLHGLKMKWKGFSLYMYVCAPIPSFHKDTSHIGGLPQYGLIWPANYPYNDPISKLGHILRFWGLTVKCMNFEGTIKPVIPPIPCHAGRVHFLIAFDFGCSHSIWFGQRKVSGCDTVFPHLLPGRSFKCAHVVWLCCPYSCPSSWEHKVPGFGDSLSLGSRKKPHTCSLAEPSKIQQSLEEPSGSQKSTAELRKTKQST